MTVADRSRAKLDAGDAIRSGWIPIPPDEMPFVPAAIGEIGILSFEPNILRGH
jgi:hypothetical protein